MAIDVAGQSTMANGGTASRTGNYEIAAPHLSRILSIQSHVAFGYVGGKAAVFPLQCLGYDVDVVNTVNFSNHSGYRRFGGTKTTAAELSQIFASMEENGLLLPSRLLTGYIPEAKALTAVYDLAKKLKSKTPELIYLLDPVIGDAGQLYVAPDVVPVYRTMLSLASIITPNWFEVEVLTDIKLSDLASLRLALRKLHTEFHVPNVVISSIPLKPWLLDVLPAQLRPAPPFPNTEDPGYLLCLASAARTDDADTRVLSTIHARCVPLIPGYFSGVGDLFSALLIGHFHFSSIPPSAHPSNPLAHATSSALHKTHLMLQLTHEHAKTLPEDERLPTDEEKDAMEPVRRFKRMRGRELRLVQGQDIIRSTEIGELGAMDVWEGFWEA
ncbi:bud site selection protein 16 [Leucogyrophana mollusca]|uniref:Bud site selection protein 16 n=1 Tax=Leucogyrophana mollusca TaxID=85980 RepID=A0ACB8B6M1_9AGAM|nr:bud site selection protein 16 [Leucogyrophana mollusca]